tara:strand:- start:1918 stop:2070 length:153 start_codon:yes stop_codon:yes gene_type:complete
MNIILVLGFGLPGTGDSETLRAYKIQNKKMEGKKMGCIFWGVLHTNLVLV